MRQIEQTISLLQTELIQLQETLDVTATGKFSSNVITPTNLSTILQYISLKLPDNLKN